GQDNPVSFRMKRIETQRIPNQDEDTASDAQRQAKDDDQGIGLAAFQVSQGDLEIVSLHDPRVFY
ncbi:MAG TPA: hypothetical protein VFG46_03205, partial [Chryseolinea sp.]|nr:hypothetical protein [Chryseolinea sp.]